MKKLLLLFALFSAQFSFAQSQEKEILLEAEVNPEFPGGEDALYAFISKNVNYPNKEKENNITGKVIARFAIMQDGSVEKITILSQTPKAFNDEVIRVLKLMPKWKPGMQLGKPVAVYFTIPIMFHLEDSKPIKPLPNKSNDLNKIAGYFGLVCGCIIGILLFKLF